MNRILFTTRQNLPEEVYPRKKTPNSAGIDLYTPTKHVIPARSRTLIGTGWEVILPTRHYGRLADVSSLAFLTGLSVIAGVIDEDYEGEICVLLANNTDKPVVIHEHTKIAQLIVTPYNMGAPAILTPVLRDQINLLSPRKKSGFGYENAANALQPLPESADHETWRRNQDGGSTGQDSPVPSSSTGRFKESEPPVQAERTCE